MRLHVATATSSRIFSLSVLYMIRIACPTVQPRRGKRTLAFPSEQAIGNSLVVTDIISREAQTVQHGRLCSTFRSSHNLSAERIGTIPKQQMSCTPGAPEHWKAYPGSVEECLIRRMSSLNWSNSGGAPPLLEDRDRRVAGGACHKPPDPSEVCFFRTFAAGHQNGSPECSCQATP